MTRDIEEIHDLNDYYKRELGWKLSEIVEYISYNVSSFRTKKFVKGIKKFQRANALKADGIVGPETYQTFLEKGMSKYELAIKEVVKPTVKKESGGNYSIMNKDGEYRGKFGEDHPAYQTTHIGLSFGAYQFTQDSGSLGKLLKNAVKENKNKFISIFGPTWQKLLSVTNKEGESGFSRGIKRGPRVRPVPVDKAGNGGRHVVDLWEEPWTDKFKQFGKVAEFQLVQDKTAVGMYLEPILKYLDEEGFQSTKFVSAAFSASIHRGANGGMNFIERCRSKLDSDERNNWKSVLEVMANEDERYISFESADEKYDSRWGGWRFWDYDEGELNEC